MGSIALIVTLGSLAQSRHAGWGLILTEVVCILLPTLLALRLERQPRAESLAWQPAHPRAVLLAIPIGLGTWAWGALLTGIMVAITGYQALTPATPDTMVGTIAFVAGLMVFAPLCEELLFRGYIFKAYAGGGVRAAIWGSALLFAFYHLRLQGLPGLLPAAFAFGILRWRTGSIFPGMAAHLAQNSMASALLLMTKFGVTPAAPVLAAGILMLGLLGLAAFVVFLRVTQGDRMSPESALTGSRLVRMWPLIPFAALFLYMGALEANLLPASRAASALPQEVPVLAVGAAEQPRILRYEILNIADEVVGSMECQTATEPSSFVTTCKSSNRSWRVERPNSLYSSDANTMEWLMRWSRADLRLVEFRSTITFEQAGFVTKTEVRPENGRLQMTVIDYANPDGQELALPPGAMLVQEWAWRLSLARMEGQQFLRVALAWPQKWSQKLKRSVPVAEALQITVAPGRSEAGRSETWVASLGSLQKAWYDAKAPHTLLRLDNGVESIRLISN